MQEFPGRREQGHLRSREVARSTLQGSSSIVC